MKILFGFYYPQAGQYRIYGHDFREWDMNALRKHISLVSQNVFLFPGTIAQNVAYGKIGASFKKALAIETLCFWPPDNLAPRSPTSVS